ncbi:MAG: aspartate-semialdehyde dehydrogenase [Deltaproteobacteria bacterium]|nr:aspartate-semialdehyde dehydrogenase [Deltaproteobacteria bacterium]
MHRLKIAVVGATGAVGRQMIQCLIERDFPPQNLSLLASKRSEGKSIDYGEAVSMAVGVLAPEAFDGIDVAVFSAGAAVSKEFAPLAAERGAVVVDNSSAWRMDPQVPLVVPEVNPEAVAGYTKKGIIANPNCSTIQMVVALAPIHRAVGIERVVVATYQAVSGSGQKGIEELERQVRALLSCQETEAKAYPHRIAFNALPHIDVFLEGGYTKEEMKMVEETRKIMGDDSIMVSATCVRVPVFYGHSEAVNLTLKKPLDPQEARQILSDAPGVKVVDDPANNVYPLPSQATGQDLTLVGRIRRDISQERGLEMWIVADNVRKGAATNTIQIAELLAEKYLGGGG